MSIPANTKENTKKDAVDVSIFTEHWSGNAKNKRILFMIHGLGEHGGRYQHFSNFLSEEFEHFYAMDLRGHGRSGGLRGYSPRFDQLIDDVQKTVGEVAERHRGSHVVVLGHSFGGLVVLRWLLRERESGGRCPISCAIISAPLLGLTLKVPALKRLAGEILGRTLSKIQLTNEVQSQHLSRDPAVIRAYDADSLVHNKMTPRLYLDMVEAMHWVNAQRGELGCPALFLIPGDDKIVDSQKTREFVRQLSKTTAKEYPGYYHEPFNDVGKEKVFQDVVDWLKTI